MNLLSINSFNDTIYDVVGVGFGPSNVSLAIALEEIGPEIKALFLEKSDTFFWHSGMLLPDATMQVSFLKDLVNPRNPKSHFTFVNYLHQKNRLLDFANLKTFFPSRVEFHDYFTWCAEAFDSQVRYSHAVTQIEQIAVEGVVGPVYCITAQSNGHERQFLARSIVHSCGLEPILPKGVDRGPRVFHNHEFLSRLKRTPIASGSHVVVAGGGQSAAEICGYLLTEDPTLTVTSIISRFGFLPADDSPFVNQIFDPEHVGSFFETAQTERERLLFEHRTTNYAVADIDVIESLYQMWYQDKVAQRSRFDLRRCAKLVAVDETGNGVSIRLKDLSSDTEQLVSADYLVCATGFRPRSPLSIMAPELADKLCTDDTGMPELDRAYRIKMRDGSVSSCFSIGTSEATHGLSATLISNMAVRSGELAQSLKDQTQKARPRLMAEED